MGYKKINLDTIVSISPVNLSGDLKHIILGQLCQDYEGRIDKNTGLIIAVTDVLKHDIGEIVPGDSNVFFRVTFEAVVYNLKLHEIVPGVCTQATDFGAFIKIGPFEGLCHVSQVMEDFNSFNPELPGFVGKETNNSLVVEDNVLARIANISLKTNLADTKIGLTMRQFGLGKSDWQAVSKTTKAKKTTKKKTAAKK